MARTNRLGVVEWTISDAAGTDTILLAASLENQKKVEEATGMGFFEYLQSMDTMSVDDEGNIVMKSHPLRPIAELFSYLQVGSDDTADEIFSCFFADLSSYGGRLQELQDNFFNKLLGNSESKIISDTQKAEEKKVND
jgi:hypothetical protein